MPKVASWFWSHKAFRSKAQESTSRFSHQYLGTFALSDTTLVYSYMTSDGEEAAEGPGKGHACIMTFLSKAVFLFGVSVIAVLCLCLLLLLQHWKLDPECLYSTPIHWHLPRKTAAHLLALHTHLKVCFEASSETSWCCCCWRLGVAWAFFSYASKGAIKVTAGVNSKYSPAMAPLGKSIPSKMDHHRVSLLSLWKEQRFPTDKPKKCRWRQCYSLSLKIAHQRLKSLSKITGFSVTGSRGSDFINGFNSTWINNFQYNVFTSFLRTAYMYAMYFDHIPSSF